MEALSVIDYLEESDKFKEWMSANPGYELAHLFKMLDAPNQDMWQLGYYSAEHNKIVTFMVHVDTIEITKPEDIFKEPDKSLKFLDRDKIKLNLEEALIKANDFKKDHYQGQPVIKTIIILQNIDAGQVYNITMITDSFKTLNIKVSSEDGAVISHQLNSLMDFNMKTP